MFDIPTISDKAWERYNHPKQKPVELLKKIILSLSDPGNIIIDPFGGSGITYAVAEAFGRECFGCELEAKYCEEIKKRLNDAEHIKRIYIGSGQIES